MPVDAALVLWVLANSEEFVANLDELRRRDDSIRGELRHTLQTLRAMREEAAAIQPAVPCNSYDACARVIGDIDIALGVGVRDFPLFARHYDGRKGQNNAHFGDFALWGGEENVQRFMARIDERILDKFEGLKEAKRSDQVNSIQKAAENWSSAVSRDELASAFLDASSRALKVYTAFLELGMGTRQRTSFPAPYLKTAAYQDTGFTTVSLIVTEGDATPPTDSEGNALPDQPAGLPPHAPIVPRAALLANAPITVQKRCEKEGADVDGILHKHYAQRMRQSQVHQLRSYHFPHPYAHALCASL